MNINETLGKLSDLGDFLGGYKESYATDSRKKTSMQQKARYYGTFRCCNEAFGV